jgi:hypothetical protein
MLYILILSDVLERSDRGVLKIPSEHLPRGAEKHYDHRDSIGVSSIRPENRNWNVPNTKQGCWSLEGGVR